MNAFAELAYGLLCIGTAAASAPVVMYVIVCAHEAAHALVARALGARVLSVQIGAGPAWGAIWIGSAAVTLRLWPTHGLVDLAYRNPRLFRTRHALVCLAGPVMNLCVLAACIAASTAATARSEGAGLPFWHLAPLVATYIAGAIALVGVLPIDVRLGGGVHPSDLKQVLMMFRLSDEERDDGLTMQRATADHHLVWRDFLCGRVDAAQAGADALRAASPNDWGAVVLSSIVALARSGSQAALALHDEAEAGCAAWIEGLRAAGWAKQTRVATQIRLAQYVLRLNRAYFLVHTDRSGDLQQAVELVKGMASQSHEQMQAATLRTRGLVQLHAGHVAKGMADLRRAFRMEEPIWLRSLCAAYLAYGHALQGEGRQAVRWLRRARSLHRRNPLLPAREKLVLDVLARQSGPQARTAVR